MTSVEHSADLEVEKKVDSVGVGDVPNRLAAAARTLPRRRFFNDMPDRGLFAAFALAGFIAIVFLKTEVSIPSRIVAGLSVSAMLLYGVTAWRLPAVQLRPDRLGDNFYYLGFIYTLASLSATLLEIETASHIDELLGNFGIALTTTILGVAGRVLFVQMRGELDDIETAVRRDLAAASADLRAQLVLCLREFETFQTAVFQASTETVKKVTAEAQESVRKQTAENTAQLETAAAEIRRQAELMGQMLIRVNRALGDLPVMGTLELPSERLEKQIASFARRIEELVAQLEAVTGKVGRHKNIRRRRWYWLFLR
jgi:hypothetical protein